MVRQVSPVDVEGCGIGYFGTFRLYGIGCVGDAGDGVEEFGGVNYVEDGTSLCGWRGAIYSMVIGLPSV